MKRQSGISMIGFIIILIIAAFFAYTAMKLVPAYMDYFSVSKALNTVATQAQSGDMSAEELVRKLDTQELSQYFDDSDIRDGNVQIVNDPKLGKVIRLSYDKKIPWLYNISFLVKFEKSVPFKVQAPQ
jgi:hypothetical protein